MSKYEVRVLENGSDHSIFYDRQQEAYDAAVEVVRSKEAAGINMSPTPPWKEGVPTFRTWEGVDAQGRPHRVEVLDRRADTRRPGATSPLDDHALTLFLGELRYDRDDREPPDNYRRGQFKVGWEDATVRRQGYRDETLRRLTWHNLGYSFGNRFGSQTEDVIVRAFDLLSSLFASARAEPAISLPEEVGAKEPYVEGAVTRVSVNAYERNKDARARCIARFGASCFVCGFSFGQRYGLVAEGFIHVHHLRPLSEIGVEYVVDPENDLRPLCPNCHAVVHRRSPAFSIEEVQAFLRSPSKIPEA